MKKYHRGDQMTVRVERSGLEPNEGIAHLADETMVIVLGAGHRVGEMVNIMVPSDIQPSLGDSLLATAVA